jgi:hypothetical protein
LHERDQNFTMSSAAVRMAGAVALLAFGGVKGTYLVLSNKTSRTLSFHLQFHNRVQWQNGSLQPAYRVLYNAVYLRLNLAATSVGHWHDSGAHCRHTHGGGGP